MEERRKRKKNEIDKTLHGQYPKITEKRDKTKTYIK